MTTPSQDRTALYRLHDAEGVLLYVGITSDPQQRFSAHKQDKPWWPDVARKSIEWYDTRADAELAEEAAIKIKSPRYNIVHCDCPPEIVTVKLHQSLVRGLNLLHRQVQGRLHSHGPLPDDMEFPDLSRNGLIVYLLTRELSARGLFGDAPCFHDGFVGWPSGVAVQEQMCPCGDAILPDGTLRCRSCADDGEQGHDGVPA